MRYFRRGTVYSSAAERNLAIKGAFCNSIFLPLRTFRSGRRRRRLKEAIRWATDLYSLSRFFARARLLVFLSRERGRDCSSIGRRVVGSARCFVDVGVNNGEFVRTVSTSSGKVNRWDRSKRARRRRFFLPWCSCRTIARMCVCVCLCLCPRCTVVVPPATRKREIWVRHRRLRLREIFIIRRSSCSSCSLLGPVEVRAALHSWRKKDSLRWESDGRTKDCGSTERLLIKTLGIRQSEFFT